ncbi:hypothetical protein B0H13DRAFT_2301399 [Mycena leptocephala]|nr:hypothetical protein B0H13DRAFT_2301399 [Mycena leptocephala]
MSLRKKLAAGITAFNTSEIVPGTVDGFPPWPGEIADPATAPDSIKNKRFANKSTALVQFFPGGEYAWLAPTRVTHLSVTQIEEFVANSRHKKRQLVNGYRKPTGLRAVATDTGPSVWDLLSCWYGSDYGTGGPVDGLPVPIRYGSTGDGDFAILRPK